MKGRPIQFCSCAERKLCEHHKRVIARLLGKPVSYKKTEAPQIRGEDAMRQHPVVLSQ